MFGKQIEASNRPDLVRWIVRYAWNCGFKLTTIRIVKYLYLIDVFSFRFHRKALTNWEWLFHHFGPFCLESVRSIEEACSADLILTEKKPSSFSENDFILYFSDYSKSEDGPTDLSTPIRGALEKTIQMWGNDTNQLLDFVYFHTEPMLVSKPGSLLDFKAIASWETLKEIRFKKMDRKLINKARKVISNIQPAPKYIVPFISNEAVENELPTSFNTVDLRFLSD